MSRKRAIPGIPPSALGTDRKNFDEAVKENLETIMGQRTTNAIVKLDVNLASTADIINKINEIISTIQ